MYLRLISGLVAMMMLAPVHAEPAQAQPPELIVKAEVVNPEDLLDSNRTIVVPTAYVSVLTDGRVAATKRSGLFQSGNATVRASASYKVVGLDKAFVQQLAQAVYDDFVAQLRSVGYTVLTYADIKERDFVKAAARESSVGAMGLPATSEGSNNFVTAAPTDEQQFAYGLGGGDLAEFQSLGKSRFTDATLIVPRYTFMAPQAWAEGSRGYKSVSAETHLTEGMTMLSARAAWMGQPKSRMMRGIPGVATTEPVTNVTEKVGSLEKTADTTPEVANALSKALSVFSGSSTQVGSSEYRLTIDRSAFGSGVLNGAKAFNREVAKAAAAAKSVE